MAAPTFVKASTGTTDSTGAWTHTAAAPAAAGNFYIVHFLQDGISNDPPTISSVTNAENLNGTANVLTEFLGHYIGGTNLAIQRIWMGRASNTSAMVITGANGGGDDVYVRVYEFANVPTTHVASATAAFGVLVENGTATQPSDLVIAKGTSNTASDAAVTTLGPDRLALNFVAVNDDNAISAFTGETGGDWALAVTPFAESSGTDGAIGLQMSYLESLSYQTGTSDNPIFGDGGTSEAQAQSFDAPSTGSSWIVGAYIGVSFGSPSDDVVFAIQADSSGSPSGSDLGTAQFDVQGAVSLHVANISASLTSGNKYWLVIRRSGSQSAGNYYECARFTSDLYASNGSKAWDGAAWSGLNNNDLLFLLSTGATGTIDGGTENHVDSDAWGVVGFALIGTTPTPPTTREPHYPAIVFQDPAIV